MFPLEMMKSDNKDYFMKRYNPNEKQRNREKYNNF